MSVCEYHDVPRSLCSTERTRQCETEQDDFWLCGSPIHGPDNEKQAKEFRRRVMSSESLSEMSVGNEPKADERLNEAKMDERINTLRETVLQLLQEVESLTVAAP